MIIDQLFKPTTLNEAMLLEDPIYRDFKRVGRYIAEQKLTEPEILQIFADAESSMTDKATGANRTWAGKGKDATVDFAKDVAGAVNGVLNSIQNSVPVAAVDVAYDQATDALGDLAGGQKGAVMDAIKKYRNLVKEYPKTAGFAKAALVAIAGMATGGAGLPAIAGLTYALDSAIKGDKLSSVLGKGAGAAALAAAGQALHGGATQPSTGGPADTNPFTNVNQMGDYTGDYVNTPFPDDVDTVSALVDPTDLATYTVKSGDTLSQIAQANNTSVEELVGLNPQLAAASGASGGQGLNPDVIFPGQQITLPPQTPGMDVYAGGVGTNANTMADIAKGNIPDSAISQGMAAKGQAAADAASAPDMSQAATDTATSGAPIDYSKAGPMSTDSLGQKLEYGIPVNDKGSFIPPNQDLPDTEYFQQLQAYKQWKSDFLNRFPNATQLPDGSMQNFKPGLAPVYPGFTPKGVQESIKFRMLPASKLIDQKATVLNWALNESVGRKSKSVNLTTQGIYTVFENVDRYRKAILEATQPGRPELPDEYRPDMPGGSGVKSKPGLIGRGLNWLDRGAKKVTGALSNFGHQFTTNVTKEKLKMNWHQAGKPSDSDQLAAWLVGQGVPQEVVGSVFGKMGIPYTAPAKAELGAEEPGAKKDDAIKTSGGQRQAYAGTNPATGKPWTVDELQARMRPDTVDSKADAVDAVDAEKGKAPAPAPVAGKLPQPTTVGQPGKVSYGKGFEKFMKPKPTTQFPSFGTASYASPYKTATAPATKTAAPTTAVLPAGGGAGVKAAGGFDAKTQAYLKSIQDKQPASLAEAKQLGRIAKALSKPVAEMLELVETKEDVQKIKQFVDQTFAKHGSITESAFGVRNIIVEHVTQVGAQRRREIARKG